MPGLGFRDFPVWDLAFEDLGRSRVRTQADIEILQKGSSHMGQYKP